MENNSHELNKRELVFCKYIDKGYNNQESAIEAGYSNKGASVTANRLLKRDRIRNYLNYLSNKALITSDYSREDITSELLDIRGLAKDDKEYHAAIRANELLGKNIGMFKDSVQVSGAVGVVFIGEAELKD